MSTITFDAVTKVFGEDTIAVNEFSLEVQSGEFLTLVGPSGSGKSTLLRMVAGLEEITDGTISIGDEVVNYLPPRNRDIAMVFQSYALYPHLDVKENMAFGLKRSTDLPEEEIYDRVFDAAQLMGIDELLDNKPKHLSGGQRQRVATGRAIVREPAVFLFDEPLSNLDAKLRKHMRTELQRLQQRLETTTIYVTHDQEEAMTMSDRIAILNEGELQQVGPPREVYNKPANLFVAQFIGSPSMNVFDAVYQPGGEHGRFVGDVEFDLPEPMPGVENAESTEFILGVRPENIEVSLSPSEFAIPAEVDIIEPLGSDDLLYFRLDGGEEYAVRSGEGDQADETEEHKVLIEPGSVPDEYEREHGQIYLTFDLDHVHVFDRMTGRNVRLEAEQPSIEQVESSTAA